MPVEHLTGRTSRRHWLLVALSIGLALAVALSMALAGDAEAKKKKKAKKFDQTSTVAQQSTAGQGLQGGFVATGPPGSVQLTGNGTPYTFSNSSKLKTVNKLTVNLTAAAFPGNPPFPGFGAQQLFLELDGVNTGLQLNIPFGTNNNGIPVAVTASGAPQNQAAVVAALKDGQASARILDQSNIAATGTQTFVFVGTANTSLRVEGTVKKKKKNKR
jgi:hypothetical protein